MYGKGPMKCCLDISYLNDIQESIVEERKRKCMAQILEQGEVDLIVRENGQILLHATIEKKKFSRKNVIEILDVCSDCCDTVEVVDKRVKLVLLTIDHRVHDIVGLLMMHEAKIHQKSDLITQRLIDDEFKKLRRVWLNDNQLSARDVEVLEGESSILINWLISRGFRFNYKNEDHKRSALETAIGYNLLYLLPNLLEHTHHALEDNIELFHQFLKRNDSYRRLSRESDKLYPDSIEKKYTTKILEIFLGDKGVAFDAVGSDGQNALDLAIAAREDIDSIEILLSSGESYDDCKRILDEAFFAVVDVVTSHLDYFKATYYMQLLATLKANGANVNYQNEAGTTPIQLAVARKNARAIRFLVDNGAATDVTTRDDAHTLLHLFAAKSSKYRLSQSSYESIFDSLATSDDLLTAANAMGDTPLHVAASSCNLAIVRKLIERGVEVDRRNELTGETPLHLAVRDREAFETVRLLLDSGAKVNSRDRLLGRRSLGWAAETPHNDEVMCLLLKRGAHMNARDRHGQTALGAVLKNSTSSLNCVAGVVQCLLDRGADIDDRSVLALLPGLSVEVAGVLKGHWVKLRAADLACSDAYENYLTAGHENHEFYQRCSKEVERLKSTRIDARTSLYRWLSMDRNARCAYLNRDTLKGIIKGGNDDKQFSMYANVILGCYREATTRKTLLRSAARAWYELTNVDLLGECLEVILGFLSNADLADMVDDD